MVLEISDQQQNIKAIAIENSPQPRAFFDPKRDITPKEWGNIEKEAADDLNSGRIKLAMEINRMSPDKFATVSLSKDQYNKLVLDLKSNWRSGQLLLFLENAVDLKQLDPDKFAAIELASNEAWEKIKSEFTRLRGLREWSDFGEIAAPAKILFTGKDSEFSLNPNEQEQIRELLKGNKASLHDLANFKLLGVSGIDIAQLPRFKDTIDRLHEMLNQNDDHYGFVNAALLMTISSAPGKGIKDVNTLEPLPEVRKF